MPKELLPSFRVTRNQGPGETEVKGNCALATLAILELPVLPVNIVERMLTPSFV